MARQAKVKTEKVQSLEASLWASANKLRGAVEPSEYKHVVLSLIFLKYANDRFEIQREQMKEKGQDAFLEMLPFYTKDNVFFIPECARWAYIMENAKQSDIAIKIDTALHEIEEKNPSLKGALPDNYYSRLALDSHCLASLLDIINGINLHKDGSDKDVFGQVYEYCLSNFALQEGKGKGEYFTPKTVVALLAELIEPYEGIVYDGACGSGGMFVQSMKFIEEHKGNKKNVSVYGQEYTATTMKLAKMNLAIRGIAANLGEKAANTFLDDQHKDLKADFSMMNPPFNQKDWRAPDQLLDDPRWEGYPVPPVSNANYGWLLNILSKLNQNGVGAVLLANGALSGDGDEYAIRKQMIENDVVESIMLLPQGCFYTTPIGATIWILNKNKKARNIGSGNTYRALRDRTNEILFMDLRKKGHSFEKKYIELTDSDRNEIVDIFHNWRSLNGTYKDIPELCYSATIEEIRCNDYTLVPNKYIEFSSSIANIDNEVELKRLGSELKSLLKEEEQSNKKLLHILEALGYGF